MPSRDDSGGGTSVDPSAVAPAVATALLAGSGLHGADAGGAWHSLPASVDGPSGGAADDEIAPTPPPAAVTFSTGGLAAGSSGSSGGGVVGLALALLLTLMVRWCRVLLVPERRRPPVFLALPERPG